MDEKPEEKITEQMKKDRAAFDLSAPALAKALVWEVVINDLRGGVKP